MVFFFVLIFVLSRSCKLDKLAYEFFLGWGSVVPHLLTRSLISLDLDHAALLFSGLGSIVLLFGVLFSQQIREDLVRAATSPLGLGWGWGWGGVGLS